MRETYPALPNRSNHQVNTPPANVRLNTIPDTGHRSPVENRPQRTPYTKGGTVNNRKTNVIHGTNPTREADEARGDGVADPDAEPGLPPRQAGDDHGAGDHPGVDVEGVGDPEADEVPGAPLPALWLDGLEIVVGEHELGSGQARLVLDGELVAPSPEAGSRALVHGCSGIRAAASIAE